MEEKRKLSGKEKFAYGIGAVGKDIVYMLSASYVLYYYQDIMGIEAWIMGVILLIARVFDAFNDPIMGVLVAKTRTRWGRFRPWLLIGTVTNAVVLYLMFAAPPSLNGRGLVAYAALSYIIWGVTYTMMDIPYWSMVPAFTEGGRERENLSALARSCAGVGSVFITIVTVMAVSALGTAASRNHSDNRTVLIETPSVDVTAYVLERDADGIPTGNVRTFEGADVSLEYTATETVLQNAVYSTQSNLNYELEVNGKDFNKDNSGLTFAMDDVQGDRAVVALYLGGEDYDAMDGEGFAMTARLVSNNEVERLGFKYFSLIIGVVFVVFILITCLFIKEKSTVDVESPSVGTMFRALVRNDQAMAMVVTVVLVNTATYITSNLLIYFFKYDLAGKNWQADYTLFNTFSGGIQILAMMLLFPLLRKFMDTMKIFYVCILSAGCGYLLLLALAMGGVVSVYPFLAPGFFIMAATGILNVLVTIFLANTVDYGELKNGRRDESVIFSMQTFVVKLASGISALIASLCLQVFHIASAEEDVVESAVEYLEQVVRDVQDHVADTISNSSVAGLRLSMTVAPVLVLLVAIFVFRKKYILTDEKLAEISDKLREQRKA